MAIIQWLQSLMSGPFWSAFWLTVTRLYSEDAMLLLVPLVYWVADRSYARYFFTLVVMELWLVEAAKGLIGAHRPPDEIRNPLASAELEGDYTRPSAHVAGITAIITGLALGIRRGWFIPITVAFPLLIGISRLYLGVHWPLDVASGWIVGAGIAYGLFRWWRPLGDFVLRRAVGVQLVLAALVPLVLLLIFLGTPVLARVGGAPLVVALGVLSGAWVGTLLEERYIQFRAAEGPVWWHLTKCVIGILLVMAVRFGLKAVLPVSDWANFLRYVVIGLVVTLGAPWLFARLSRQWGRAAKAA